MLLPFSTFQFWHLANLTYTSTVLSISVVTTCHFDSYCLCSLQFSCAISLMWRLVLEQWQLTIFTQVDTILFISVFSACYFDFYCHCSLRFSCDSSLPWLMPSLFSLFQLWQLATLTRPPSSISCCTWQATLPAQRWHPFQALTVIPQLTPSKVRSHYASFINYPYYRPFQKAGMETFSGLCRSFFACHYRFKIKILPFLSFWFTLKSAYFFIYIEKNFNEVA